MTLDEAIEEIKSWNSKTFEVNAISFSRALGIAIEALERTKDCRTDHCNTALLQLMGETEE